MKMSEALQKLAETARRRGCTWFSVPLAEIGSRHPFGVKFFRKYERRPLGGMVFRVFHAYGPETSYSVDRY